MPRVVSTLHGLYSHEGQRPLARRAWRTLERASAQLSDLILCQSTEDVRTARHRGIVPDERLRPLGNGVDLKRFSPTRFGSEDRDAIRRNLKIMDLAAFDMCREHGIPIIVFNMKKSGNIVEVVRGANHGTRVVPD